MSSDPVSWTIYVLIVFVILIANGLVSASLADVYLAISWLVEMQTEVHVHIHADGNIH